MFVHSQVCCIKQLDTHNAHSHGRHIVIIILINSYKGKEMTLTKTILVSSLGRSVSM